MIMIKAASEPVDLVIIKLQMPTSIQAEEKIDKVYEELERIIHAEKG